MDSHYPPDEVPATPEYVLAVLRDLQRQEGLVDLEANPDWVWSFETTISEWDPYWDLSWRELVQSLNKVWGMSCSDEDWKEVLEPAHEKHLAGVCALIARHTRRPVIRPARLLGCRCAPAGAFLTIRSLLREAGAPPDRIAPSTPLEPYARRYSELFIGPISRLAPGALPQVRWRCPALNAGFWAIVASFIHIAVGYLADLPMTVLGGLIHLLGAFFLIWITSRWLLPSRVEIGDLHTFRDLALVLAEGSGTS